MRKEVIAPEIDRVEAEAGEWLDVESLARVELTSEDGAYPIESALAPGSGPGWRAAAPGEQLVRIVFDEPQTISRIGLLFEETSQERTQEFVLRWSPERSGPAYDVVRQQWTFHPPDGSREVEDYRVELRGVRVLELAIVPDIGGRPAHASLRKLRIA